MSTVQDNIYNVGIFPHRFQTSTTKDTAPSSSISLGEAGLFLVGIQGAATVVTVEMPLASNKAGTVYVIRSLTSASHVLTGSEASGYPVFTNGTSIGSALIFPPTGSSSVTLICDGVNYCVLAKSGSFTFAV